jgi:hypothetical protein
MLDSFILPRLSQCDNYEELRFLQGGAPADTVLPLRAWLVTHLPGRWIVRRGPTEWFASDGFLWGYSKENVHRSNPSTLESEQQIRDIFFSAAVPLFFLRKNVESVSCRLQKYVKISGLVSK